MEGSCRMYGDAAFLSLAPAPDIQPACRDLARWRAGRRRKAMTTSARYNIQ